MDPRTEQIKYLSIHYAQTKDPIILNQILFRINPLILRQIRKLKCYRKHLYQVSDEELHQSAILGVLIALQESPQDENSNLLQLRILRSISKQIHRYYPPRIKERIVAYVPPDKYFEDWEAYDLYLDLFDLVLKKVMTYQDMELFLLRVHKEYSWVKLRDYFGISCNKLINRFYQILSIVVDYLKVFDDNEFK